MRTRYERWESPDAGVPAGEVWATVVPPDIAYVAYMTLVPYQRRGYAQEAMRALNAHLGARCGLQRLYAEISPANEASGALIGSLGFRAVDEAPKPTVATAADRLYCLELRGLAHR